MDEINLVQKAKSGDKEAFCELYMLYRDRLYRYAYYRLGNSEDAQDAVSSTVIEAYQNISKLINEKAFSGWLFKIHYRSCCSLIKEQSRQNNTEDIESLNKEAVTTINYDSTELNEALDILREEEREIVLLSAVAGYNSREIADTMGLKHSTVRSKLSRSLSKMRKFLE